MERGGSSSSTEAPSASGAEALGADHATHAADTFSPLLWIPHVRHRVTLASTEVCWFLSNSVQIIDFLIWHIVSLLDWTHC